MGKKTPKTDAIAEFGDFQTPPPLAAAACMLLKRLGVNPRSVVEPTCGVGNFLSAAAGSFPDLARCVGVEINPEYIAMAGEKLAGLFPPDRIDLNCASFFSVNWTELLKTLPEPILLVGNPPWVTNSDLGVLGSVNLPVKKNFQNHNAFDAVTGKSNFDISEWMLIHLLERMQNRDAVLAMLCKTAVARKVLTHAWKTEMGLQRCSMFLIDAAGCFDAAVDACFLFCSSGSTRLNSDCEVFSGFDERNPARVFGFRDRQIIADISAYSRWNHLQGTEHHRWRSGIKHDCSAVMELRRTGDLYSNSLGESVDLEPDCLYPLLKSSDLANGTTDFTDRVMLVTQRMIGADTHCLSVSAPKTWDYLQRHADRLDRRGSSIYQKRPRFSVFGVGEYSFSPWKVAISGLYKSLKFRVLGPVDGRPIVLDDTGNFIPCATREEAEFLAGLLNSPAAAEFFSAFIFWDAKRPVTVEILRKLDLLKLAEVFGKLSEAEHYIQSSTHRNRTRASGAPVQTQALLF